VRWVQARDLSESIRQVRLFTHAVKYNMLEMCPPALCAYERRLPCRWHSHSWLCSVQFATAAVRDRVTALRSPSLRAAGFWHSDRQFASNVESISCTSKCATAVESYSCKRTRGAPPPTTSTQLGAARVPHPSVSRVRFFPAQPRGGVNLTTPLLRAPNLPKMGFTAARLTAGLSTGFSGLRAREAGCSSPLEYALTQKRGWGVPPPAGFSR
jgi:hypothetical protein